MKTNAAIKGASAGEIMDSVRDLINSGDLTAGDSLPPIRGLAEELGVNRNTVALAYRRLIVAGVAESRRRGGTVIATSPAIDHEGFAPGSQLRDLASGNPDPELLPDFRSALVTGSGRPLLYGAPAVSESLMWSASARLFADARGAGEYTVAHGAVDAAERALNAHLARGDLVAVEDPCFLASIGTLQANGYVPLPVRVDDEGMAPDALRAALEAGARAVVCTPRAHNPTGASTSRDRAAALRDLLTDHPHALVVEDDHFSAVSSSPYHRIASPATRRWALVRSVSKFLGPDLRVAVVRSDPDTAERISARLSTGTTWVSHTLQETVAHLLESPEVRRQLDRAREAYSHRRLLLTSELAERGVPILASGDGLNVWVGLDTHDEAAVVRHLAELGWRVRPGSIFSTNPTKARRGLRITTSELTAAGAAEFASDLTDVLSATGR